MINRSLLLLIVLFATSCASRKAIVYFQPQDQNSDTANVVIKQNYSSKIQSGDILNINEFSLSPEANAMFNVFPEAQAQQSANQNSGSTELAPVIGFLVDKDGTVTLPLAGKI